MAFVMMAVPCVADMLQRHPRGSARDLWKPRGRGAIPSETLSVSASPAFTLDIVWQRAY